MAKKETATKYPDQNNLDKIADTRPKAGWKPCSKCDKWIKGPNTPKCYHCGHDFPKPATKVGRPATKQAGIGDTLTLLDKIKTFIKSKGGTEKATATVTELETLIDDCGSVDELKQAIETLGKWGG